MGVYFKEVEDMTTLQKALKKIPGVASPTTKPGETRDPYQVYQYINLRGHTLVHCLSKWVRL